MSYIPLYVLTTFTIKKCMRKVDKPMIYVTITTNITEWLLIRVLLLGSFCRFNTQYDPHNKRRKSSHSQQKQSHKLKSHFQFLWHTLKVFNFACMNFCERLKFSNLWVFSFVSHHNRSISCVLNFLGEKVSLFSDFFFLIFRQASFLEQY